MLVILAVPLARSYRFKELWCGISPRMLSQELQELEQHQLVKRTVCDTRLTTVEYESTAHGRTLLPVVPALGNWGYLHHEAIVGHKRSDDPAASA